MRLCSLAERGSSDIWSLLASSYSEVWVRFRLRKACLLFFMPELHTLLGFCFETEFFFIRDLLSDGLSACNYTPYRRRRCLGMLEGNDCRIANFESKFCFASRFGLTDWLVPGCSICVTIYPLERTCAWFYFTLSSDSTSSLSRLSGFTRSRALLFVQFPGVLAFCVFGRMVWTFWSVTFWSVVSCFLELISLKRVC